MGGSGKTRALPLFQKGEPMSDEKIVQPVTVELDMALTRRSRVHAVIDGNGEQVYHAKRFSEVLVWLMDHDQSKALLIDERERFYVVFHRPT